MKVSKHQIHPVRTVFLFALDSACDSLQVCVSLCARVCVCVCDRNEVTGLRDCVVERSKLSVSALTDVGQNSYIRMAVHTHTHTYSDTHTAPPCVFTSMYVSSSASFPIKDTSLLECTWSYRFTLCTCTLVRVLTCAHITADGTKEPSVWLVFIQSDGNEDFLRTVFYCQCSSSRGRRSAICLCDCRRVAQGQDSGS